MARFSDNPFHVKTGDRAYLSLIEFKKFAPDGKMTLSQFKRMCLEKNYEAGNPPPYCLDIDGIANWI